MNMSTRKYFKRKITSNPITSGMTVYEDVNIYETDDDEHEIEINFDKDEMIERLDILIDYAQWDLERNKDLLLKVEGYDKLCENLLKYLKICRNSYVKVLSYSSKMVIGNAYPDIDYPSAVGDALSVDFTADITTNTANNASVFDSTTAVAAIQDCTTVATETSYA